MLISFPSLIKKYNLNVTGVIHVGGHVGQELLNYKKSGIENLLIFEPQKQPFEKLSNVAEGLKFENITLENKALGNCIKKVEMICNDDGLCSSILKPKVVLTQYPDIKFDKKEIVNMIMLDSHHLVSGEHNYNFMNMDTQGYELEVLKGSSRTLERVDAVYTEVNNAEVYENNAMI